MRTLILGSGGREHALALACSRSFSQSDLFIAPGNAGTTKLSENVTVSLSDFEAITQIISKNAIDLVIIGPEQPLVDGLTDHLKSHFGNAVLVVGPSAQAAQLEGSKRFAKDFMLRNDIPTAQTFYANQENLSAACDHLEKHDAPYVLKADGLAAGKGVIITNDLDEAKSELKSMVQDAKFGDASSEVLIEEFMTGIEFSVFALSDGTDFVLLPEAKDYKRIGEGDQGLNTGGMGAVSPVPFFDKELKRKVLDQVVKPTFEALKSEGMPYVGFLYFGLMNVQGEPKVVEYNCRMGDPETQVVLSRIENDFTALMKACGSGKLAETEVRIDQRACAAVVVASGGYPESYQKGFKISGIDDVDGTEIYHAGTQLVDQQILTSGGRVLTVSALGHDLKSALNKVYKRIDQIDFEGMCYRKDIGHEFI